MNDGGAAFPLPETDTTYGQPGMTLRDWFAGQALIAFMSSESWIVGMDNQILKDGIRFKVGLSVHAYEMADAMIAARAAISGASS